MTFVVVIKTYRHRTHQPAAVIRGLLIVALLWVAFRPELLFVNKSVDHPFPATITTTSPAQV